MLRAYHDENYSSNLMTLAVIGNQTLDELQILVEPLFSKIRNRNIKISTWNRSPYRDKELLTQIDIVPIQNIKQLFIKFYVPDPTPFFQTGVKQLFSISLVYYALTFVNLSFLLYML
jgi:insulysin